MYVESFLEEAHAGLYPSADLMLITDVLEHVLDPEKVLSLMSRASRPGGYVYVTVPNSLTLMQDKQVEQRDVDWRHANRTCQHLWMMTPDIVQRLVEKHFRVIGTSGYETDIRGDSIYTSILAQLP